MAASARRVILTNFHTSPQPPRCRQQQLRGPFAASGASSLHACPSRWPARRTFPRRSAVCLFALTPPRSLPTGAQHCSARPRSRPIASGGAWHRDHDRLAFRHTTPSFDNVLATTRPHVTSVHTILHRLSLRPSETPRFVSYHSSSTGRLPLLHSGCPRHAACSDVKGPHHHCALSSAFPARRPQVWSPLQPLPMSHALTYVRHPALFGADGQASIQPTPTMHGTRRETTLVLSCSEMRLR